MADVLADCWDGHGFPPQWRSLYGNLLDVGGVQRPDGKVVSRAQFPPTLPWWSSVDGSWRWMREHVAPLFPEPTRWESRQLVPVP
jgi:hypothetical protein